MQWNARLSAARALRLIDDDAERRAHVETIVAAGERYTWERTGKLLMGVYEQALTGPMRPARACCSTAAKPDANELPAGARRARGRVERPAAPAVRLRLVVHGARGLQGCARR